MFESEFSAHTSVAQAGIRIADFRRQHANDRHVRGFDLSRWQMLTKIYLPAVTNPLLTGLGLGASSVYAITILIFAVSATSSIEPSLKEAAQA